MGTRIAAPTLACCSSMEAVDQTCPGGAGGWVEVGWGEVGGSVGGWRRGGGGSGLSGIKAFLWKGCYRSVVF